VDRCALAPTLLLVVLAPLLLSLFAAPVLEYANGAAAQLVAPDGYIEAVLGTGAPPLTHDLQGGVQ
jgi:hypothetical protein